MDVNHGDFGLEEYNKSTIGKRWVDNDDHGLHGEWKYKMEKRRKKEKERKMVKRMLIAQLIPVGVIIATITLLIILLCKYPYRG